MIWPACFRLSSSRCSKRCGGATGGIASDRDAAERAWIPAPASADSTIRELLEIASPAPSGSNIQPWELHVLTAAALSRAFTTGTPEKREYNYYPVQWRTPYLERRRSVGWALYRLAGVAKSDRAAGDRRRVRNFTFFGAPAGLVFTIDRDMESGGWLDYGMFLENIMVAARGYGLDTCPQAVIAAGHVAARAADRRE